MKENFRILQNLQCYKNNVVVLIKYFLVIKSKILFSSRHGHMKYFVFMLISW